MATSSKHKGWLNDIANGRLAAVYNGTEVFDFDANDMAVSQALTVPALTASGLVTMQAAATVGTTLGVTGVTTLSDELRVANGKNIRVGTISAFATTEPTNAIVFKTGTEFAGAITTSGGLMSSNTVVRKVIADGTVSNVET